MKLKKLIEDLQYMLDTEGNVEVYQASDPEGNSIRQVQDVDVDAEYDDGGKRWVVIWPNDVDLMNE